MSKCARCGSYQDERIIGGRYALVCRDNGHTVFEVKKQKADRDYWNVEFNKGQSTITLLVGVEHEGRKGKLVFLEDK